MFMVHFIPKKILIVDVSKVKNFFYENLQVQEIMSSSQAKENLKQKHNK